METNYNIPRPYLHLELGDWIAAKSGIKGAGTTPPMYVTGIFDNGVYLELDGEQGDPFEYGYRELKPIPITDELIEGLGLNFYKEAGKSLYVFSEYGRFVVTLIEGETSRFATYRHTAMYVHELQHLLRLYGIRKQIIL